MIDFSRSARTLGVATFALLALAAMPAPATAAPVAFSSVTKVCCAEVNEHFFGTVHLCKSVGSADDAVTFCFDGVNSGGQTFTQTVTFGAFPVGGSCQSFCFCALVPASGTECVSVDPCSIVTNTGFGFCGTAGFCNCTLQFTEPFHGPATGTYSFTTADPVAVNGNINVAAVGAPEPPAWLLLGGLVGIAGLRKVVFGA